MLTMVDVGASSVVMFTATWSASEPSVDALGREIASGYGEADAGRIKLSFAPMTPPKCHALLGDGTGSFETIATSLTSGVPPYDALFNLSLQGVRPTQVRSAMRGERGHLAIEYVADLLIPSIATATLRSHAAALLPWLRARRSRGESIRGLLDEAIESGLATVTVDAADHPDGEVATELYERVLTEVTQLASRWIAEGGSGDIEVGAALERDVREPVRAFADIGGIVASGSTRP